MVKELLKGLMFMVMLMIGASVWFIMLLAKPLIVGVVSLITFLLFWAIVYVGSEL